VLNPVQVQMMQLILVKVKYPHQEGMGRHHEATLVEMHEQNHEAHRWIWSIFRAREQVVSLAEEPTRNKGI
jgi:hypothetical protein